MSLIIPDGFALASFRMQIAIGGDPLVFTLGLEGEGPDHDYFASLSALAIDATASGFMFNASAMSNDYQFLGISATVGTPDGPLPVVIDRFVQGTASIDTPPVNSALLVKKRTALGGKRNRGRMFLPPAWISEGAIGARGNFTTAGDVIQSYMNDLYGLLGDNDLSPMLLHAPSRVRPEDPVPPPTPIVQFVLERLLATQRQRMR